MSKILPLKWWDRIGVILLNLFAFIIVAIYLVPMAFMFVSAFKTDEQFAQRDAPLYPARPITVEVAETIEERESAPTPMPVPTKKADCNGFPCMTGFNVSPPEPDEDEDEAEPADPGIDVYEVYYAPEPYSGDRWVLLEKGRLSSTVAPADDPGASFEWEGKWRTLERVYEFSLYTDNFTNLGFDYWQLVGNTMRIVVFSTIGMMLSSILVAYGFARYPLPGGRFLFLLLIGTIILPEKITLVPTYFTFVRVLGWVNSFLPLIVPHLFGSAILIFLLRQNFMAIPKEMEEAAMIDGAGPLRILWSVILPQSIPVIVTVLLLHFFYIWNETRMAVLYLSGARDMFPISMGVATGFASSASRQAQALVAMIIPALVLFAAQPIFMRGVKVTGAE